MRVLTILATCILITACTSMTWAASIICTPPVVSSVHIAEETSGFKVNIKYPVLCSTKATRTIRDRVEHSLSEFKMIDPNHDLSDFPHKYEMLTQYDVWSTKSRRLASVKLLVMEYTGGAHPNNWPETWVFDLTDGCVLTLTDVFVNQHDALKEIAAIVRDVLPLSLGEMFNAEMLADGTRPSAENYEDFILNEEGIVFFFAPYQVAPYAAGQQVVTIPYNRVIHLLTPTIQNAI